MVNNINNQQDRQDLNDIQNLRLTQMQSEMDKKRHIIASVALLTYEGVKSLTDPELVNLLLNCDISNITPEAKDQAEKRLSSLKSRGSGIFNRLFSRGRQSASLAKNVPDCEINLNKIPVQKEQLDKSATPPASPPASKE